MTAVEDLAEVATRAASAECVARSIKWQDRVAVARRAASVAASLDEERVLLRRPGIGAVEATSDWSSRLEAIAEPAPVASAGPVEPVDDAPTVAARADADATAAVTVARIALGEAHLAVLNARLAALDAGDSDATVERIRGYAALADGNLVLRHVRALGRGVRDELRHILRNRPRKVALRLGISLGIGLSYLGFLRIYQWDVRQNYLPYLALYALSGVLGGVVCTNALSVDAARVRAKLVGGARLWHIIRREEPGDIAAGRRGGAAAERVGGLACG